MIKKTVHLAKSRDTQNQVKIRDCPVQNGMSGQPTLVHILCQLFIILLSRQKWPNLKIKFASLSLNI